MNTFFSAIFFLTTSIIVILVLHVKTTNKYMTSQTIGLILLSYSESLKKQIEADSPAAHALPKFSLQGVCLGLL